MVLAGPLRSHFWLNPILLEACIANNCLHAVCGGRLSQARRYVGSAAAVDAIRNACDNISHITLAALEDRGDHHLLGGGVGRRVDELIFAGMVARLTNGRSRDGAENLGGAVSRSRGE